MPTFSPGPSTLRAPFPALPSVVVGTPFQTAGAPLITALQTFGLALDDRLRVMASTDSNDLSGDFRADVQPALDAIAGLASPADDPDLSASVGVFDEAIVNLEELATTLPDPFEGIDAPPVDAPFPDPSTGFD
jgi:hypothetical protein